MLMVAEQRFRRLKAPELIEDASISVHSMRMESPLNQRLRRSPPDVVYTPIDVTSSQIHSTTLNTHKGVKPALSDQTLPSSHASCAGHI